MSTYALHVMYSALPGKRKAFLDAIAAADIPAQVRTEDGCIRYDYFLSLQNETDILLIEEWASPEHQQRHMAQPHMALLRQIKEQYIADSTWKRFAMED